jgi:hypothetical protein
MPKFLLYRFSHREHAGARHDPVAATVFCAPLIETTLNETGSARVCNRIWDGTEAVPPCGKSSKNGRHPLFHDDDLAFHLEFPHLGL